MYKVIKYKMRTLQIKYIIVSREDMRQYFNEKGYLSYPRYGQKKLQSGLFLINKTLVEHMFDQMT